MFEKQIKRLADAGNTGWVAEPGQGIRKDLPDGMFLRILRAPDGWVVCRYHADGTANCGQFYKSFKAIVTNR